MLVVPQDLMASATPSLRPWVDLTPTWTVQGISNTQDLIAMIENRAQHWSVSSGQSVYHESYTTTETAEEISALFDEHFGSGEWTRTPRGGFCYQEGSALMNLWLDSKIDGVEVSVYINVPSPYYTC
jgi:hypothetical protein